VTHPSDDHKGGDVDPDVQVHESCDVGDIGVMRDLKGLEIVSTVCKEYLLVPHFEGEEDNQCKMKGLPVAEYQSSSPLLNPLSALKLMFRCVSEVQTSFLNLPVEFFEGLESHYDMSAVSMFCLVIMSCLQLFGPMRRSGRH
jgi:hypothetical protein